MKLIPLYYYRFFFILFLLCFLLISHTQSIYHFFCCRCSSFVAIFWIRKKINHPVTHIPNWQSSSSSSLLDNLVSFFSSPWYSSNQTHTYTHKQTIPNGEWWKLSCSICFVLVIYWFFFHHHTFCLWVYMVYLTQSIFSFRLFLLLFVNMSMMMRNDKKYGFFFSEKQVFSLYKTLSITIDKKKNPITMMMMVICLHWSPENQMNSNEKNENTNINRWWWLFGRFILSLWIFFLYTLLD